MMNGTSWGYGLLAVVFWLVLIALIVLLVIWAVRAISKSHDTNLPAAPATRSERDNACEIARTRYAKGEIDKEQYDEICTTLGV